jgi:hypothetical protein
MSQLCKLAELLIDTPFRQTVPHMMHAAALSPLVAFVPAALPRRQVLNASAGTDGRAIGGGNTHPWHQPLYTFFKHHLLLPQ